MIDVTLKFLRAHFEQSLRLSLGQELEDGSPDLVKFPTRNSDSADQIQFASEAVTMLLVNLEEERELRDPDPYRRINGNGSVDSVQPDINLALCTLFVACFNDYVESWKRLAAILQHLQSVPVLDRSTDPNLPDGLERLAFELVTQSFSEQNDMWNALRTHHHPSLLYRVRLLTIRDTTQAVPVPISEVIPVTKMKMRP